MFIYEKNYVICKDQIYGTDRLFFAFPFYK